MIKKKSKKFWIKKKSKKFFPKKKKKTFPALTIFKLSTHKRLHTFFFKKKKSWLTKQFIWKTISKSPVSRFFPYTIESFGKSYSTKLITTFGKQLFTHINKTIVLQLILQIKKSKFFVDQNLIRITSLNFLSNVRNRTFFRLRKKLPLRGQRTHTNARTRRRRNVQ